ncbi:MAG: hypothetical protein ACAH95_06325, partial [Fimbriimonas sp.]
GVDYSSFNVPIQAHTTGDVWFDAFERTILPALERFKPEAIVLQLGTDTHFLDPLGHLRCAQQDWLAAAKRIKDLGLPLVSVGGGGYEITTVPRMWASAVLTLSNVPYADEVPADLAKQWGMPFFSDHKEPTPWEVGREHAEGVIAWLEKHHLPNIR